MKIHEELLERGYQVWEKGKSWEDLKLVFMEFYDVGFEDGKAHTEKNFEKILDEALLWAEKVKKELEGK